MCIFISAGFVGFAIAVNATRCCEPGLYMRENRTTSVVYCLDSVNNVTQPSVLVCKTSSMFSERQKFFNVSYAGEVVIWHERGPEVMAG